MKPQRATWRDLAGATERQIARLASIASNDCWQGGARAMALAVRMPCRIRDADTGRFLGGWWTLDNRTARDIVSSVYTSHDGTSRQYMAYECPECGSAHLGEAAALRCCSEVAS